MGKLYGKLRHTHARPHDGEREQGHINHFGLHGFFSLKFGLLVALETRNRPP
jgi:hypothetical protein